MSAIPLTVTRIAPPTRLPIYYRLVALLISALTLTPLLVATHLTPDSKGFGTHTQLKMQPCEFLARTGIPCPACGMTTSWTYFAHGNFPASFYVQPMGMILALLAGVVFWTSLYVAWTGQPVYRLLCVYPSRYYMIPLLVMGAGGWAWKIFIHLRGIDGWK